MTRWPWSQFVPTPPAIEPSAPLYDPALEPPPLGDVGRRGEAAQHLLNDPTLAEAFKEIREDAYREWLDSKRDETARREDLYRIVQALELVRAKLVSYRAAARIRAERQEAA